MISAHSGGAERARPGSLSAYQAVVSSGAEYAEFDVRRAGDGTLVAQHSADSPSGPGGPGGSSGSGGSGGSSGSDGSNGPSGAGREPELAAREVMEVLAAGGVRGHVDLKGTGFERDVVELARSSFGPDGFVVTTADPASVAAIGAEFPAVPVGLSVGFGPASITRDLRRLQWPLSFPLAAVQASGASWVAMSYRFARPEVLDRCVAAGLRIMIWTVNDDRRLARLLSDPRVAVVVTDRPEHAVALRARLAARTRSSSA
jgi:glycerophosphoryl diester phosphodiesterase